MTHYTLLMTAHRYSSASAAKTINDSDKTEKLTVVILLDLQLLKQKI